MGCHRLLKGGSKCPCTIESKCKGVELCGQKDLHKREQRVAEAQLRLAGKERAKQHKERKEKEQEGKFSFNFFFFFFFFPLSYCLILTPYKHLENLSMFQKTQIAGAFGRKSRRHWHLQIQLNSEEILAKGITTETVRLPSDCFS